MNKQDKACFDHHYKQLLKCLKLQGKADNTIDSYSRGVRRLTEHFDCLPESLSPDDLKNYFAALVVSHSWSTVKVDRLNNSGDAILNHPYYQPSTLAFS